MLYSNQLFGVNLKIMMQTNKKKQYLDKIRYPDVKSVTPAKIGIKSTSRRKLFIPVKNYILIISMHPNVFLLKIVLKFVNQPYPTKIEETRPFFVFLKKSKFMILVFDSAHKPLQIIFITFFD